jgi:hypothetical protein
MPKAATQTTRTSQKYLRALAWFHENGPATAQQVRDAGVPFEYFDLNRILKAGLLVATGAVAKHLDADGKPTRGRPSPFYEITPQGVFVLTEATQPEAVTPGMRREAKRFRDIHRKRLQRKAALKQAKTDASEAANQNNAT